MNVTRFRAVLLILFGVLLLAACATSTPTPTAAPLPTRPPAPFIDVLEMQFNQAADPLPDGPVDGLIGLYSGAGLGDQAFLACQLERTLVRCSRHALALDGVAPGLVQIDGQVTGGVLSASRAEALAWDEAGQRAAAQAKLDEIAGELASHDWSLIAAQEYEQSSGWFRPDAERLRAIPLELHAYDSANDLVIWRGQGWELPKQTRIVFRFPVLYFVTDPAGELPTQAFVTIEGYVEE
jgi:hypothetical protein